MKKVFYLCLFLATALVFTNCNKDDDDDGGTDIDMSDCSNSSPTYNGEVKSLLDTNCANAGCHDSDTAANGIDLSTYNLAKTESENTRFLGSIQHKAGFEPMPLGGDKLSNADIEKFNCWVQNGSPE